MLGKHSPNSATPQIYYSVFYALNSPLKHSLLSWFRDIVKQNKGHMDTSTNIYLITGLSVKNYYAGSI